MLMGTMEVKVRLLIKFLAGGLFICVGGIGDVGPDLGIEMGRLIFQGCTLLEDSFLTVLSVTLNHG